MNEQDTITDSSDVTGFLATARRRFSQAAREESHIRSEAKIDQAFANPNGKGQWSEVAQKQRADEKRPCEVFNLLPIFIQSVANEARMNKPQPKVNPISGGAKVETARILNGIIRHIQYNSKADLAYDGALEAAATSGFGFFRFVTEESPDPESFEQEIIVKAVQDPFTIYGVMIPNCLGRRVEWAFVVRRMSRDDYNSTYRDSKAAQADFRTDDLGEEWGSDDDVQVAEYWYTESEYSTLQLLSDGKKVAKGTPIAAGVTVVREREVCEYKVKQAVINGVEILSETEWLGTEIPIVGVYGKQLITDGKIEIFSLIRGARSSQREYNLVRNGILEKLALGNRVPYVGYMGQFKDPKWRDANTRNYAYIEVEPVLIDGRLAPIPQRQQLEEQVTALSNVAMQVHDGMKAIMGIFDSSIGDNGQEVSGVAIGARQRQSNITNLHFSDNLNRAEWTGCLIMLDLIPKVYIEPGRIARTIGDDDTHKVVTLNQPYTDENGKEQDYQLSNGKYDVVVTTGPSYTTARQESAATLSELLKAEPALINVMGDIWANVQDTPWSETLATRFKKLLPPALQEDQTGANIPPQIKQKLDQSGQMIQQLTDQVHQLAQEIESKKFELESRERIAKDTELTKRTLGLAALEQKDGVALLVQEIQHMRAERDQQNATAMQDAAQQHQSGMQAADQQHQTEQQAGAQQHAADSQAADHAQQTAQMEAQPEQGE